jgi:hypothetical protein
MAGPPPLDPQETLRDGPVSQPPGPAWCGRINSEHLFGGPSKLCGHHGPIVNEVTCGVDQARPPLRSIGRRARHCAQLGEPFSPFAWNAAIGLDDCRAFFFRIGQLDGLRHRLERERRQQFRPCVPNATDQVGRNGGSTRAQDQSVSRRIDRRPDRGEFDEEGGGRAHISAAVPGGTAPPSTRFGIAPIGLTGATGGALLGPSVL